MRVGKKLQPSADRFAVFLHRKLNRPKSRCVSSAAVSFSLTDSHSNTHPPIHTLACSPHSLFQGHSVRSSSARNSVTHVFFSFFFCSRVCFPACMSCMSVYGSLCFPTSGRKLLGVDDFGSILLSRGDLHTPSDHRECAPGKQTHRKPS